MTWLFLSLVFSSIGMGYFVYGKKQESFVPMLSGIALMVYPYFIYNSIACIIIGVILMATPFIFNRWLN